MHNCTNYLGSSITNSDFLRLFFKQKYPLERLGEDKIKISVCVTN